MKEFNLEKFCKDLVALRGKESQEVFAQKLDIKRPTLSLLENGKQVPTIDLLSKICSLTGEKAMIILLNLQQMRLYILWVVLRNLIS